MTELTLFERASRAKLRFATKIGDLDVESLWDLPLQSSTRTNLDDIARGLHRQLKEQIEEESFVTPNRARSGGDLLQLSFDVVRRIIEVRVAERDAAEQTKARAEMKQKIAAIIEQRKDEDLRGKSLDELQQLLKD